MILNHQETNDLIVSKLQEGIPFSILRIDNTMGYVIDCISKSTQPLSQFYNENSLLEAGIYPSNMEYAYNVVVIKTIQEMVDCDILGFVDISGELSRNYAVHTFLNKPLFFGNSIYLFDPAGILNISHMGKLTNPWTQYLKNKKVLVVSTHSESIKQQWKNVDKIWGDKRELIAPFELVDCIRSPYHPSMDDRQLPDCPTWLDSVECIKKQIESYDFDVLLTSSTTSSPFYANHAKKMGKVGIQTGGSLQLFFGIYGYRWYKVDYYKDWHKMYNDYWISPLQQDEAQKRNLLPHLETNFAYW